MYGEPPGDDKERATDGVAAGADLRRIEEILRELLAQFEVLVLANRKFAAPRGGIQHAEMQKLALCIAHARRARIPIFNRSMFGEPAWDMLLELFINVDYGARHSVGRLCDLSGAPPTTALRWLDYLEKEKLVSRQANPTDRRTEFVEITDKGRSALEQYVSGTLESLR
jgi:DNA-binding MarR family transcriptional regulator